MIKTLLLPNDKPLNLALYGPARAITSASNIHRRALCPGSAVAETGLPDEKTEWSIEGDMLHYLDAHPNESRDRLKPDQLQSLERNVWLRDRFLRQQMLRLGIDEEEAKQEIIEQEFFFCDQAGMPLDPPFPGHPDRIIYWPRIRVAVIFDSKFGRKPVPPASINMQLRSYAIMFSENFDCDEILAAITQPWAPSPQDFHAVIYKAADLPGFKDEILKVVARSKEPDAPLQASVEACDFCKAKAICRAAARVMSKVALSKMPGLSIEQLEDLGEDIEIAKSFIHAWEHRLRYIYASQPDLLKKYYVSEGNSIREITDAYKAFHLLRAAELLPLELDDALKLFLSCADLSRHQLEIALNKKLKMGTKVAQQRIAEALGDLIVQKKREGSLKKRQEVRA